MVMIGWEYNSGREKVDVIGMMMDDVDIGVVSRERWVEDFIVLGV